MESWHGWLQRVNFRNYIFLSHNFFLQSNFSFISILFTAQTRTVGINVKNSILLRIVLFSICILSLIKKLNTRLCFSLSSVLQMSFSIISYNSFFIYFRQQFVKPFSFYERIEVTFQPLTYCCSHSNGFTHNRSLFFLMTAFNIFIRCVYLVSLSMKKYSILVEFCTSLQFVKSKKHKAQWSANILMLHEHGKRNLS